MRIVLLILLLSTNLYAQNNYRFFKKGSAAVVKRTTAKEFREIAQKVIRERAAQGKAHRELKREYTQRNQSPMQIAGDVGYLKGTARVFKDKPEWAKIYESGGYNGPHHIVTKSVLEEMDLKGEAIANAPGVFHPLHNDKYFEAYFHNHELQLQLYEQGGIKLILENFFKVINEINEAFGFPKYNQEFIDKEMFEAEIWARYWGLKWQ